MGRHSTRIRDNPSFTRQALYRAVDNSVKFGGVLRLAPLCQSAACVFNAEPGGVPILFLGSLGALDLEQESLHDEFFNTIAQSGFAFWLEINMKMLRLDYPNRPGLLQGLSLSSLAVRQPTRSCSFRKNPPVSTGSVDQQKLKGGATFSVADRRYLERKEP